MGNAGFELNQTSQRQYLPGEKLPVPFPHPFPCLGCCSWSRTVWGMFSVVFSLWRKLQRGKERGRRGRRVPDWLRGMTAKALLLSPCLPSLLSSSDSAPASRIWREICCGNRWGRRARQLCVLIFPRQQGAPLGLSMGHTRKVLFRKRWAVLFSFFLVF